MNFKWELQKFDTDLFGFTVSKIEHVDAKSVASLITDLQKNNISYASYRLPASSFPIIHALEKNHFLLVDGTLALELKNYKKGETFKEIRSAKIEDIPLLRKLAGNVFTGTRFYVDPAIPKRKADELYATWIENSVRGSAADKVLVWEESGEILGFVTLQKKGHIGLIAVSRDAQGKGIGRKLVQSTFAFFLNWHLNTIALETQTTNLAALRTYQSCGFKIVNSYLTYRWISRI